MKNIGFLRFDPLFYNKIWGGNRLKTVLGKSCTDDHIGESWEISGVANKETIVSTGKHKGKTINELIQEFGADLVGVDCYYRFRNKFPLLIKFIDTAAPLSIQVHPDDVLAKERHGSFGKNEMWYILDADKDSELVLGFKSELNKKTFLKSIIASEILSQMNFEKVTTGDVFNIPAGRIHAIGKGILLVEIQQTSDITYRVYDYDRIDQKTNKKRELHIDQSIDAIDFKPIDTYKTEYDKNENKINSLVSTPFFVTRYIELTKTMKLKQEKNIFRIFICLEGKGTISSIDEQMTIKRGQTIFVPANLIDITIDPLEKAKFLEVSV
ncbi:type I phosphomannose isomerase catalytic subunit [uncultured Aquimarina sp.]|uniref:type I phosphomannose isomerase catalytic subunit n=1 Tax=uncultured Aquimarina sp. TaxID=575652 RepID=UPI002636E668|nr:type I phosphomannose isomerase catalytic subunit [uncultured Aquimarina sp.]